MREIWTVAGLLIGWTCLGVACSNGRNPSASSETAGTAAGAGASGGIQAGPTSGGAGETSESGANDAAGAEAAPNTSQQVAGVGGSDAASGAGGAGDTSGVGGSGGAGSVSGAGGATVGASGMSEVAAGSGGRSAAGSNGAGEAAGGGTGGAAGMSADSGRGGAAGMRTGGARPGFPSLCDLPADCVRVETEAFTFEPCCRIGLPCGYRLTEPADFAALFPLAAGSLDGCVPVETIFSKAEPHDEERIVVEGGEDILLTPACESRNLLAFPLWGCCKPSGVCGYSTDQTADILAGQSMSPDAGFSRYECATGAELNAQFRASPLAGLAHLPEVETRCDYAAIASRNPR